MIEQQKRNGPARCLRIIFSNQAGLSVGLTLNCLGKCVTLETLRDFALLKLIIEGIYNVHVCHRLNNVFDICLSSVCQSVWL